MLKVKWLGLLWVVPLSVALLAGCNSGGDSKGASASALASVAIREKAMLALDFLPDNHHFTSRVVARGAATNLGKKLAAVHTQRDALLARSAIASRFPHISDTCTDGTRGTHTQVVDADTGVYTDTYVNCVDEADTDDDGVADVRAYRNGVESRLLDSATSFKTTYGDGAGPLVARFTRISDGRLIQELSANGVASGTIIDGLDCGVSSSTIFISMTISATLSHKEDSDLDGKLDRDESDTMTGFTAELTGTAPDLATCEVYKVAFSESGKISVTDNLNAKNSLTIDMPAISSSSVKAVWEAIPKDIYIDESTQVNGTMTITSACFTGTMTLATTTPVFLSHGDKCPTAGELKVSGGATATITYTSTGSVNVDEGSNGSIDKSYKSCDDAGACA